jgi:hypothetical protein
LEPFITFLVVKQLEKDDTLSANPNRIFFRCTKAYLSAAQRCTKGIMPCQSEEKSVRPLPPATIHQPDDQSNGETPLTPQAPRLSRSGARTKDCIQSRAQVRSRARTAPTDSPIRRTAPSYLPPRNRTRQGSNKERDPPEESRGRHPTTTHHSDAPRHVLVVCFRDRVAINGPLSTTTTQPTLPAATLGHRG